MMHWQTYIKVCYIFGHSLRHHQGKLFTTSQNHLLILKLLLRLSSLHHVAALVLNSLHLTFLKVVDWSCLLSISYRAAFYSMRYHAAIISLIFPTNCTNTIEYLYCSLNICYMFRRSLRHHQGKLFIASPMKSEEIKKKVKKEIAVWTEGLFVLLFPVLSIIWQPPGRMCVICSINSLTL